MKEGEGEIGGQIGGGTEFVFITINIVHKPQDSLDLDIFIS